jgi:hypothetical protein
MRTLWLVCTFAFAIIGGSTSTVSAYAQSVTTFDGKYNGVSATKTAGLAGCQTVPVPGPIFITGGVAQLAPRSPRPYQGTVTEAGYLTLRNGYGIIITAHIDQTGKIEGASMSGVCSIVLIWQKEPPGKPN